LEPRGDPVEDVHIPKMGMSTVEVDVIRVLVQPGQRVAVGEALIEIETEKTAFVLEAEVGGTVVEVLVAEGDFRNVGDVVLRIEKD
jgi:pyruvate/2-oxoglutarate dehydrogenase complex dihydrolipoamide acyltransferase (E2) component